MVVVDPVSSYIEYDEEILNHIHKVLLEVLTDFVNICEENNIGYFCAYGTALGAVRHQGFIPWDDDVDILMFRKDYEKFHEVMKRDKSEKYDLFSIEDEGFFRFADKLNLKNTKNGEKWYINPESPLGLGLDIFILDNVPVNKFKRYLFKKRALHLKSLNLALVAITYDRYHSKYIDKFSPIIKKVFKLLGLNQNFVRKRYNKLNSYPKGKEVCELSCAYTLIFLPIECFSAAKKVKFENIIINIPEGYDEFLKIVYGDYMTLPPIEERVNHGFEIDFGPY